MHDVIYLVKYVYALCALGLGLWGLRFLPFGVKGFGAVGHPALVFAVAFLGVGFSLRFVFLSGSFVGFSFICFCLLVLFVWVVFLFVVFLGLGIRGFCFFFVFFCYVLVVLLLLFVVFLLFV